MFLLIHLMLTLMHDVFVDMLVEIWAMFVLTDLVLTPICELAARLLLRT